MSPLLWSLAARASSEPVNPSVAETGKVVFLTAYERKGVAIMAVAGVCSCALVSSLLLYIIFTAVSPWPKRQPGSPPPFTSKQIAVFVICLLVSDLIQSISGITQVKWASENRIYEGPACSVQAATLVMGDLGSTVWSCVIAVHTFCGLALGKHWPRWAVISTVFLGWIFVILLTLVPAAFPSPEKGPFFAIAGTWCFISSEYAIPRLGIHYVPLFVAAIVIFVFYGLVFLVLRGNISFQGHGVQPTAKRMEDVFARERIAIAKRMLWYPIAYLMCIFPIAIIRLVGLKEENVPDSVWIFGMFFLFLLGAVDSVIYTTTRKLIKPINPSTHLRTFSESSKTRISLSRQSQRPESIIANDKVPFEFAGPADADADADIEGAVIISEPQKSGPFRDSERLGAIHVTLERIQEVI